MGQIDGFRRFSQKNDPLRNDPFGASDAATMCGSHRTLSAGRAALIFRFQGGQDVQEEFDTINGSVRNNTSLLLETIYHYCPFLYGVIW